VAATNPVATKATTHPAEVKGSLPKDSTPIAGVVPGMPDIPASNTKTVALNTKGSAKETQPLVVPENVQWTPPVNAKPRDPTLPESGGRKALVTMVLDGDSAKLRTEGTKKSPAEDLICRLDKIDAPETAKKGKTGQPYGEESKMSLKRLIEQKNVSVWVSTSKDQYGRDLCQIEIDGADVSLKQLESGAAWLYKKYGNPALYGSANTSARIDRKGLYADPKAVHPRFYKHPQ
jgi:endonuclease YncB( thermonuclease family)